MACHGSLKHWCLAQAVQLWRLVTVNKMWESALLTLDVWCQEGSGPERYCCWRRCWSRFLCILSHHTRPLQAGTVSHAPLFLKEMRSDISNHAEHSQDVGKVSMCVLTMIRITTPKIESTTVRTDSLFYYYYDDYYYYFMTEQLKQLNQWAWPFAECWPDIL